MQYTVTRPEVHISYVQVEAESLEDAISKVRDEDKGEEISCQYEYTLENGWSSTDGKETFYEDQDGDGFID